MAYGNYNNRPQYKGLMDMFDGGGAGRSGDRFEGGGLLSLLANELFRPAGYEERLRQRKNGTGRAVTTVIKELTKPRDKRNLDRVDAYNRAEADRQAAAALMDRRYDGTILEPGQGGLRRRLPQNQPTTVVTNPSEPSTEAFIPQAEVAYPPMEEMQNKLVELLGGNVLLNNADGIKKLYRMYILENQPVVFNPMSPHSGALLPRGHSPATDEFKNFIKIQRDMEDEYGFPRMSMEELLNVYRVYRERNAKGLNNG